MSAYNYNKDEDDDDDLLASLGGSLFKDLLADLQAEDNDVLGNGGGAGSGGEAVGWLSLEQLEQELSHLDAKGNISSSSSSGGGGGGATLFGSTTAGDAGREHFHLPPLSAASLVVDRHHAQAQLLQQQPSSSSSSSIQQLLQTTTVTMVAPPPHADAWSLSWQQFGDTAQDFLQADAAIRKQQHQQQTTTTTTNTALPSSSSPSIDFSQAQEYNISEQPRISPDVLAPPPGMARGAARPTQQQQPPPPSIPEATLSETTGNAATAATANVASVDLLQQAANKLLKDLQQQQQQPPPTPPVLGGADTAEPTAVLAPIDEFMAVSESQRQSLPPDQGPPVTTLPKFSKPALTPQNSVTIRPDGQVLTMTGASQQQQHQQQSFPASSADPPMPPATSMAVPLMPPVMMSQQQGHSGMIPHGPPPHPHQQQPPPPMMMQPQPPQQQGPPPPPTTHAMMPPVPVAIPVARAPWSTTTRIMPPSTPAPRVLLCHPRAAPIPAAHLASKYMSPRDIAYVVHSILKTLNVNTSTTDYDEQWFARQTGTSVPTSRSYAQSRTNQNESTDGAQSGMDPLEISAERAKAWSTQHAALGHVAKTNVARPRALIANPALSVTAGSDAAGGEGGGSEQENAKKQRAVLWKARLYCDRAYQAFFAVMETWQLSRNVAQVQPHLMKLLKCLGVTSAAAAAASSERATTLAVVIDPEPLQLVCKLNKGRILLARIMEQALLPPQAMSSMLPTVWSVCLSASSAVMAPSSSQRGMMTMSDPTDDRLFAALARVLTSLPNLDGAISLACLQTILKQPSKAVLESTVRMQAAHALLQRGASLVTAPGSEGTLAAEWSKAEDEFMQLLQGQR